MNRLLNELSISTNLCLSSSKASGQFSGRSTDLIVVDWDDDSAAFVSGIRNSMGWKKPVVVAVSSNSDAVRGADFVVGKPIVGSCGAKSLKVAYSRMLYNHRKSTRYALMTKTQVTDSKGAIADAMILDIGDGGVGLSTRGKFAVGEVLSFRLLLPEMERSIAIQARVQWTRQYGAIGCEFLRIPPVDLDILHDWLISRSRVKKPLVDM